MFVINAEKPKENFIPKKMTFSESPFGRVTQNEVFHKNTSNYSQFITIFVTSSSFSIEASNNSGSSWVTVFTYGNYNQNNPSTMMQFVLPRGYWLRKNSTGEFTGYIEQLNY